MENDNKKKKKILHLVEAFGGGVFTFLVELVNSTINDYDIVIAYSRRMQTPDNFEKYFDKNVKFIEVKNFKRSISAQDFKACKEVKQIVKSENPDIVHMHSSKAGMIGRAVLNDKKYQLFFTPHSYAFFKKDDSKFKVMQYVLAEKMAAIYKSKCVTVACSPSEYKVATKITKNVVNINNGVDIVALNELVNLMPEKKFDKNKIKICTLGRVGSQKNPKLFNEIAKRFQNIEFVWIGEGELEYELTSSNITVTGWKERKEALEIMNECDIFLLPSLWEGLPISLLEAMYLKKLCFVSDVVGNRDVIVNGINGFICKDVEQFECMVRCVEKGTLQIENIQNNAKKSVEEKYNMNLMSKKYSDLYKNFNIK